MGEILTSDLRYGGNLNPDGSGEQPKTAQRGDPLPKGYEGPPSVDELRELGVLVDETQFLARGGFEREGGVNLPGGLGQSMSSLSQRQAALRAHAEEQDENQVTLREGAEAGKPAEEAMGTKEKKATKKEVEDIEAARITRPEIAKETAAGEDEPKDAS